MKIKCIVCDLDETLLNDEDLIDSQTAELLINAQEKGILIDVNGLISPTGKVGYVNIATGPLSSQANEPAEVPIETAIVLLKDMGRKLRQILPDERPDLQRRI